MLDYSSRSIAKETVKEIDKFNTGKHKDVYEELFFSKLRGYKFNKNIVSYIEKITKTLYEKDMEFLDLYDREEYNPYMMKESLSFCSAMYFHGESVKDMIGMNSTLSKENLIFSRSISWLYLQNCKYFNDIINHRNYNKVKPLICFNKSDILFKDSKYLVVSTIEGSVHILESKKCFIGGSHRWM